MNTQGIGLLHVSDTICSINERSYLFLQTQHELFACFVHNTVLTMASNVVCQVPKCNRKLAPSDPLVYCFSCLGVPHDSQACTLCTFPPRGVSLTHLRFRVWMASAVETQPAVTLTSDLLNHMLVKRDCQTDDSAVQGMDPASFGADPLPPNHTPLSFFRGNTLHGHSGL